LGTLAWLEGKEATIMTGKSRVIIEVEVVTNHVQREEEVVVDLRIEVEEDLVTTNPEEALDAPTVALLTTNHTHNNNNSNPLIIVVVDTKEASNNKTQEEVTTTEEEEAIEVDLQVATVQSLAANLRKCLTLSLGLKLSSLAITTN
jgi:hypothetical protein